MTNAIIFEMVILGKPSLIKSKNSEHINQVAKANLQSSKSNELIKML